MNARRFVLAGLALVTAAAPAAWAAGAPEPPESEAGLAIYRDGVLGSGAALEGSREDGVVGTRGADAACVNCHQRSGLGSKEGRISIPPVTGQYLFHARGAHSSEAVLPFVETMHGNRDAYTDATLARSIREGVDSNGRRLSLLMPRFALGDADMAALIAYLRRLGAGRVPGVTPSLLHFATIFTPDADPARRRAVLDVLRRFFDDKNEFPFGPSPAMQTSGKTGFAKSMYMANRHWQLHVWDLTGPAATWREQLERHVAEEPVFAVLSGLGGSDWRPVHDFCERNAIPCLFPNVEVPVDAGGDFYSLYFSKGVLLEGELISGRILGAAGRPLARVVEQLYRRGDSGEAAARSLAASLGRRGIAVHGRELAGDAPGEGLAEALQGVASDAVLVLWLRPGDVAALENMPPVASTVYMSGLMGGLERAPLPPSWRERTVLAYPFDLPDRRGVRVDYPLGWFAFRHIAIVDERLQADTFLACSLVAEVLHGMADAIARPYLVEQMQGMLEHRLVTGYYPHLSLATRQRFASKGGYLAHFAAPTGIKLVADGGWVVP